MPAFQSITCQNLEDLRFSASAKPSLNASGKFTSEEKRCTFCIDSRSDGETRIKTETLFTRSAGFRP